MNPVLALGVQELEEPKIDVIVFEFGQTYSIIVLKNLDLNIPVFIVTINKTESTDIVAFDLDWKESSL